MHKFLTRYAVYCSLFLVTGCTSDFTFTNNKILNDYPSGSGITYLRERIYLIGDDVNYLLVADTAFTITDSIKLFESQEKRLPKPLKPDLEGVTLVSINKQQRILLVDSGSLMPYRNSGWLINPFNKEKTQLDLNTFYNRIRKEGIDALNIEGVATIPRGIVFASRGNKSFRENYLIFTANEFWNNQDSAEIRKCKVGTNTDTASFQGVSGLEYSKASDHYYLRLVQKIQTALQKTGL